MAELIRLNNGLRICYEKKATSMSCAFGVFVNAGSRNENVKNNGIAHFIEHMTFKGTKTRSAFQIADETDMMGANSNAYTSKSSTVYYIAGLNKFAERYVEILGDLLWNSTYTEENMEKERNVILEEIHMYDDDGESLCSDLLSKVFYGKHPFSRPILGTKKTVSALTPQDIADFRARWYRPENIVLSFSGNVDADTLVRWAEKYFVDRMPSFDKPFVPLEETRIETVSAFASLKKPFEQANILMRFPSVGYADCEKKYAPSMMGNILGGGMSSRLFQSIREDLGLVYEVYASNTMRLMSGEFDIGLATSPDKAEEAVRAIRKVIDEVRENGFSDNELIKTRNQYETSFVLSSESAYETMRCMGRNAIGLGILQNCMDQREEMLRVTAEDIRRSVERILCDDALSVTYVGKNIGVNLSEVYQSV